MAGFSLTTVISNACLNTSVKNYVRKFDGIDRNQFHDIVGNSTARLAPSPGRDTTNLYFSCINSDGDDKITLDELSDYLQRKYDITIEEAISKNWNVVDLVKYIEHKEEQKERAELDRQRKKERAEMLEYFKNGGNTWGWINSRIHIINEKMKRESNKPYDSMLYGGGQRWSGII